MHASVSYLHINVINVTWIWNNIC